MDSSFLKKREEKPKVNARVKPITMCRMFFKEGDTLNNSELIEETHDFVLGIGSTFIEGEDRVYVKYIDFRNGIINKWTVYK